MHCRPTWNILVATKGSNYGRIVGELDIVVDTGREKALK
jgi:hypothetical protein